MQIEHDVSESDALTISKSASALGVHEFSLFTRIQAGERNERTQRELAAFNIHLSVAAATIQGPEKARDILSLGY